ncbi:hypothetical protein CCMSSC00406_0009955 [Pleurotus cornucopiae]|nr:hypothetical protein CCMSSC00406_0009955 [Pleurotus cornucopiae]
MFNINNGTGQFTVVNGSRVFQQPPRAEARANDDIIPADKVIAIMGLTGVGKSTFINIAAGSNTVVVGHALNSSSKEVQAVEIDYQGQRVVLVDTPGFDDTDMSDTEVLNIIANWLKTTYRNKVKLTGIIYMHRISDNRMAGTPMRNLKLFAKLCGTAAAEGVVMTTTMWDTVEAEAGRGREQELRNIYWKGILDYKARMERFDSREGQTAAWNIIRQMCNRPPPAPLLIQEEMVTLRRELCETTAGAELYCELLKVVKKKRAVMERLSRKVAEDDDVDLRRALRDELHQLDAEVKMLINQVNSLKVPLSKRLRRMFCFGKVQTGPIPMS